MSASGCISEASLPDSWRQGERERDQGFVRAVQVPQMDHPVLGEEEPLGGVVRRAGIREEDQRFFHVAGAPSSELDDRGTAYIAMELLAGESLHARLVRRGPDHVERARERVDQRLGEQHRRHHRGGNRR